MSILGVPYGAEALASAVDDARAQSTQIANEIVEQGGPGGLGDKKIIALIAYLQRLGTDITKVAEVAPEEDSE